jgi:hypothetical protein
LSESFSARKRTASPPSWFIIVFESFGLPLPTSLLVKVNRTCRPIPEVTATTSSPSPRSTLSAPSLDSL